MAPTGVWSRQQRKHNSSCRRPSSGSNTQPQRSARVRRSCGRTGSSRDAVARLLTGEIWAVLAVGKSGESERGDDTGSEGFIAARGGGVAYAPRRSAAPGWWGDRWRMGMMGTLPDGPWLVEWERAGSRPVGLAQFNSNSNCLSPDWSL
jgi:hypothetical protein